MATRYGVCLNSMGWTGRAGPARDRLMPDVPSIDAGLPQKASAGATQRAHLARHAGPPQEHGSIKGERRRVNALRPAGPLRLLPGTLPVADGHHPGCGAGPCFDSGPDASRSAVAGYLSICCQSPVLGGSIGRTQGRAVRCCLMPMPVSMPASAAIREKRGTTKDIEIHSYSLSGIAGDSFARKSLCVTRSHLRDGYDVNRIAGV